MISLSVKKGFTFVELLIALTIFSIVATSIYYTLHVGIDVWLRGNVIISDNQTLRVFIDRMNEDLVNAVTYEGMEYEWKEDAVLFKTSKNVFKEYPPRRELADVRYYLDPKEKGIVRAVAGKEESFDIDEADRSVIVTNVKSLDFEYAYAAEEGYDWKSEWTLESLPRIIRVKMRFQPEGEDSSVDMQKTFFMPRGSISEEEEEREQ